MTNCRSAVMIAFALAACLPAIALSRTAEVIPDGQLMIGGEPVRCGKIQTLIAEFGDIAEARQGWILLNPQLFTMPTAIQHFWYAHECAHHLFGADEQRADCWAIQKGRQLGWFQNSDLKWMRDNLWMFRGDATHLPGPQRLFHLTTCFNANPASDPDQGSTANRRDRHFLPRRITRSRLQDRS